MTLTAVADIFRRVLDAPEVAEDENFFDIGGDSLLATRVLSAVSREFDVELTFDDFLLAATPATLAKMIESMR
jgi:acyl carrier protein